MVSSSFMLIYCSFFLLSRLMGQLWKGLCGYFKLKKLCMLLFSYMQNGVHFQGSWDQCLKLFLLCFLQFTIFQWKNQLSNQGKISIPIYVSNYICWNIFLICDSDESRRINMPCLHWGYDVIGVGCVSGSNIKYPIPNRPSLAHVYVYRHMHWYNPFLKINRSDIHPSSNKYIEVSIVM